MGTQNPALMGSNLGSKHQQLASRGASLGKLKYSFEHPKDKSTNNFKYFSYSNEMISYDYVNFYNLDQDKSDKS